MTCEIKNSCALGECVIDTKGLASNSASPTDTYLLTLKDNSFYNDPGLKGHVNIKDAFMKLFISPQSWRNEAIRLNLFSDTNQQFFSKNYPFMGSNIYGAPIQPTSINSLIGLEYEHLIYKEVTTPLIENNICPHFVRYFMGSNNPCSLEVLEQILNVKTNIDLDYTLKRNLYFMFYQLPNRPKINDTINFNFNYPVPNFDNLKIEYIVNQAISPGTVYFEKYMMDYVSQAKSNLSTVYTILFQIALACYALELSKAVHNDLHYQNIWISPIPKGSINIQYIVDGTNYIFNNVTLNSKLYDFDRVYCERFKNNPTLGQENPNLGGINDRRNSNCSASSQCNQLFPRKDFAKIMCYVNNIFGKSNIISTDDILNLFVPVVDMAIWRNVYQHQSCFLTTDLHTPSQLPIALRYYNNLQPYTVILKKIYDRYIYYGGQNSIAPDIIYNCNYKMFDSKGIIIPSSIFNSSIASTLKVKQPTIIPYRKLVPPRHNNIILQRNIGETTRQDRIKQAEQEAQRRKNAEMELKRLNEARIRRNAQIENRRLADAARQADIETKRLADAKKREDSETKRLADIEIKRLADIKRQADIDAKLIVDTEIKKLADIKRQADIDAKIIADNKARQLAHIKKLADNGTKRIEYIKAKRMADAKRYRRRQIAINIEPQINRERPSSYPNYPQEMDIEPEIGRARPSSYPNYSQQMDIEPEIGRARPSSYPNYPQEESRSFENLTRPSDRMTDV
jgi:hypothetical protein